MTTDNKKLKKKSTSCRRNLRWLCSARIFVKRKSRALLFRAHDWVISIEAESSLLFYNLKTKSSILYIRISGKFFRFFGFFLFALFGAFIWLVNKLELNLSDNDLFGLALAIGGIIGTSIAIIFSFSTFILQSTSDLFSTQYLNQFVEDKKEKLFFWILVFLTALAFLTPFVFQEYVLEGLLCILFFAFYFIYDLYTGLRKRINPEETLKKIKDNSLKKLEQMSNQIKKHTHVQKKFCEIKEGSKASYILAENYQAFSLFHYAVVLENVKYLYEIGLRLLTKNEISAFDLTIRHIRDIYLKHLELRNGYFIREPVSFLGSLDCNDQGVTVKIFEYLQSIGERIIQEKRKENIYSLLKIYENIFECLSGIKYVDEDPDKNNPLLNLALAYYVNFIEKILASKENDWVFKATESLSNVSSITLNETDDMLVCDQINETLKKISMYYFTEKEEAYLEELVGIYFTRIYIAWNKYRFNSWFWENLFKELKLGIIQISILGKVQIVALSNFNLFSKFSMWQNLTSNHILELKDSKKQEEGLSAFIDLLEKWDGFLLDFARELGLNTMGIGFSIIQSVETNLRIINRIKEKRDVNEIYINQFNILSWYFKNADKAGGNFPNFNIVLRILLEEICNNLKNGFSDADRLITQYIRLIEMHFKHASSGHLRIITNLIYLGLLLSNYQRTADEEKVLSKIYELNNKYLESPEGSVYQQRGDLMLCKKIQDLGRDLFSSDLGRILKKNNIIKKDWDDFVKKINYCKDYDLTDLSPDLRIFDDEGLNLDFGKMPT